MSVRHSRVMCRGTLPWKRARVPRPPLPLKKRQPTETLVWVVKPKSIVVNATFYTDGSFRDGEVLELGMEGWAFAAFDDQGTAGAVNSRKRARTMGAGSSALEASI